MTSHDESTPPNDSYTDPPAPTGAPKARPSTVGNAIATTATSVLIALIGFVTGTLAARLLGPAGRGDLAAIQLWPSLLSVLAMMGLGDALVYHAARDPKTAATYVATAVAMGLAGSVVVVAAGLLLLPTLLGTQPAHVHDAARWYLLIVPLQAVVGLPYHSLRGVGDFAGWNVIRVVPSAVWLSILACYGLSGATSAVTLAGTYLFALATVGCCTGYIVRMRVPGPLIPRITEAKALLRYGLPALSSSGPGILSTRLDQMLLLTVVSSSDLGQYVVSLAWANAASPALGAIAAVTFPKVAGSQSPLVRAENVARAVRTSMVIAALTAIPMALLAPIALPFLFGPEFARASTTAAILSVAGAVAGVNQVLQEGLRGLGRPGSILSSQLVSLSVAAAGVIYLLPDWGIAGAGVAGVAGALAGFAVLMRQAAATVGLPVRHLCVPGAIDLMAVVMNARNIARRAVVVWK